MSSSRNVPMRPVEVTKSSSSIVGQLLGDSLVGSCWRAVEQAVQPDVEVRVYVRTQAEALVALDIVMGLVLRKNLLDEKTFSKEEATAEAKALGSRGCDLLEQRQRHRLQAGDEEKQMSKGPRRWVKRRQRWIIIFEGPTGRRGCGRAAELAVRSKPFPGTVYPSAKRRQEETFQESTRWPRSPRGCSTSRTGTRRRHENEVELRCRRVDARRWRPKVRHGRHDTEDASSLWEDAHLRRARGVQGRQPRGREGQGRRHRDALRGRYLISSASSC